MVFVGDISIVNGIINQLITWEAPPKATGRPNDQDHGKTNMCIMCSDTGWWLSPTPLKNHGVKVSWDDDIPNIWKNKIHVPNHQPVYVIIT